MKSGITFGLLLALASTPCLAQQKPSYEQNDPAAKSLLDGVSRAYKSYHSVSADFILKVLGPDLKPVDSKKGSIILQGTRYRITLDDQELYCDGKTTWTYTRDANEVQVNNYEADNGTITPSRLFTNFYDREFLYRLSGTIVFKGKKLDEVEMTPMDKSRPFFKVNVDVDPGRHLISRAVVFDKSGNRYTYQVTHFKPNVPVNDTLFTFQPSSHPHVEVVDLR